MIEVGCLKRRWRIFGDARAFARKLELCSLEEWNQYIKGKMNDRPPLPADIPPNPQKIYKMSGWKGFPDWLCKKKYRSYEDAREFVHRLGLRSEREWRSYTRGEVKDLPNKPKDIPIDPRYIYKEAGWRGMSDWLGKKKYRSYEDAREFVHKLGLRSEREWRSYTRGEVKDLPNKPKDIPVNPRDIYKDSGWNGIADWLGKKWRSFEDARRFARNLGLDSEIEWKAYINGEMQNLPEPPKDIPQNPRNIYKDSGWKGIADWLGRKWRPFYEARAFARTLNLGSFEEWVSYCGGKYPDKPFRPQDIPSDPSKIYMDKGWQGYADWLGKRPHKIGKRGKRGKKTKYMDFEKARDFVRKLNLRSSTEWLIYCQGGLKRKRRKPKSIPTCPHRVYKKCGWKGYRNWLGNEKKAFEDAREFVQRLNLRSIKEWKMYCHGNISSKGRKPKDIPTSPDIVYKKRGWKNYRDWLGYYGKGGKDWKSYDEAKKFVHQLDLSSIKEWNKYVKELIPNKTKLPDDIPHSPYRVYKNNGWKSFYDWLGKEKTDISLPFNEARKFARNLGLKSSVQWRKYIKGQYENLPKKPKGMPIAPENVYRNKGWLGYYDWLGYEKNNLGGHKEFLNFEDARPIIHKLKLKSSKEWFDYCKGLYRDKGKRPLDIPYNPALTYKDSGWKGWRDWLGNS